MRRAHSVGFVALLAFASLGAGCRSSSAPRLSAAPAQESGFDPPVVDLGRIPWNSVGAVQAAFRNGRAEEVTIASMRASCNCTGFRPSDYVGKIVPAGGTLPFSADVHTGLQPGVRTTEIELMLTSGAIYSLAIEFECFASYTVEPREISLGEIGLSDVDSPRDAQVVLFRSDSTRIVAVEPDVAWIDSSFVESGPGVMQLALHPRVDVLPHGRHVGTVHVSTTDPYVPQFAVRVTATGVADLRPVPAHVFVRRGREGAVTVLDRNGHVVNISEYGGDTEGLTIGTRMKTQLYVIAARDAEITGEARRIWIEDDSGRRSRFFLTITE